MDKNLHPLTAESVVSRLKDLIELPGDLPVTFGEEGMHVRNVELIQLSSESGGAAEILIVGR